MEMLAALLADCEGNPLITNKYSLRKPIAQNFDDFFVVNLNRLLNENQVAGDSGITL